MRTAIKRHGASLRTLAAGLARDFAPWPVRGARLVDELECLLSVLLAIGAAHLLGARNIGWAAFSAYMVIRASFADSLDRGSLRVLGTAAGAALAWALAWVLACCLGPAPLQSPALLSAALAAVGGVTLYLALMDGRAYGWLFAGLTFAMVLVDGMEHVDEAVGVFALSRLLEVLIGTGAAVGVSALSARTLRRRLPPPPQQQQETEKTQETQKTREKEKATQEPAREAPAPPALLRQAALRHAQQGAVALALIPWVWHAFHVKALSQSSVTIMAVMMVPVSDLAASADPASLKLRHRFFGCGIGALLATGILVLSHGAPAVMTLAACLGVVIGRHIENGALGIGYAGTQFALAFLVVLVPDCYTGYDIAPGLERLLGILAGMALLEPVRLLFKQAARANRFVRLSCIGK